MYYNIHSYTKGTPPFHEYTYIFILIQVPVRLPTYVVHQGRNLHAYFIFRYFLFWSFRCIHLSYAEYLFDTLKSLKPD